MRGKGYQDDRSFDFGELLCVMGKVMRRSGRFPPSSQPVHSCHPVSLSCSHLPDDDVDLQNRLAFPLDGRQDDDDDVFSSFLCASCRPDSATLIGKMGHLLYSTIGLFQASAPQ